MRHAVIVGVKGDELDLLDGGSEHEVKASFKMLKTSKNPDQLDRIEMWTRGSGRVARFTYPPGQPAKPKAKKAAKKAAKTAAPDDDFGLD